MSKEDLDDVEQEIKEMCSEIKVRTEAVRAVITRQIQSPNSFYGCLQGSVDDYMESFDGQIAKLEAKFDSNRLRITKENKVSDKARGLKLEQMKKKFDMFQAEII